MTQEELEALPECGGFGFREEIRDGRKFRVPYALPSFALFHRPDEPMSVVDIHGQDWMIGWMDGVKYKRRM